MDLESKRTIHDPPLVTPRQRERALNALIELVRQLRPDLVNDRIMASEIVRRLDRAPRV